MELTQQQYEHLKDLLPRQRGNVKRDNRRVLAAILYVVEQGGKWRGLPEQGGKWHTIYTRMNRWAKKGVLDRIVVALQQPQLIRVRVEVVSLDSPVVPVHPARAGRAKKTGPQAIGKSRGGWTTKIHLVAADAGTAVSLSLSPGQAGDAPEGRKLLAETPLEAEYVVMDRAYEGEATRQCVRDLGATPVVPPKSNRRVPWPYDRAKYKKRNEVERLFRRLKGFRRIFSRFDKLDVVFAFFIHFALIIEALRSVNTP